MFEKGIAARAVIRPCSRIRRLAAVLLLGCREMKLSELIAVLAEILTSEGDVEVNADSTVNQEESSSTDIGVIVGHVQNKPNQRWLKIASRISEYEHQDLVWSPAEKTLPLQSKRKK